MKSDDTGHTAPDDSNAARSIERNRIRHHLRYLRQQMDDAAVARKSSTIATEIPKRLDNAQSIGAYLAFGHEVSVDGFMAQCRARGQATYVPVIQADHTLVFAPVTDSTAIVQNKYGIREPDVDPDSCLPATSLDIVIMPLLGFDPQCNRMGMGGGYYDRTFAHKRREMQGKTSAGTTQLIGVAFELQCVPNVFADWWDVPMDHVITEERTYSRSAL